MVYKKADFETLIKALQPTGYKMATSFGSSRFIREEKNRRIEIGIGYNEYFPYSAVINGVSVELYFAEVENIFTPLCKKHGVDAPHPYTIGKSFQSLEQIDYSNLETEIKDEDSFNIVKKEVQKIIEIGALPFIEKYSSLESVAELLASKKAEEISPYIQGAKLLPKTILILKLSKHPSFREKLVDFYNILKQYSQKKAVYLSYLNLYDDLFEEDLTFG